MSDVKLYLIVHWSEINGPEFWRGKLIKHYGVKQNGLTVSILSGVLYDTGKPVLIADSVVEDVTHFVQDIDNITQEELQCLSMSYPHLIIQI